MALISRLLASRIFRFGFVALTLAFAAWYIVGHWSGIRSGLNSIGLLAALGALACVLAALVCTMLVWRALMAGLGSPLSVGVASRVVFVGQLGKYLPGSVWPVLAQIELASEHKVPRARRAADAAVHACSGKVLVGFPDRASPPCVPVPADAESPAPARLQDPQA
jgi:hypothetical protein